MVPVVTLDDLSVLVVEDDLFTRQLITAILRKSGVGRVHEADNALSGYQFLSSGQIDVVISDLEMPSMDGLSFIRRLRIGNIPENAGSSDAVDSSLPVIVLTAHASPEIIKKVRAAGADGFIAKPVRPRVIMDRLSSILPMVQRDKDIKLFRVVYASAASPGIGRNDIVDIFRRIQQRNFCRGAMGGLCLNSAYFLQVLEGPRSIVEKIFANIEKDDRHHDIKIIFKGYVEARTFKNCSVNIVSTAYPNVIDAYQRYSGSEVFSPRELTLDEALGFMVEIANG
jgi:two-component system chemotaxis response regulator CheY